MLVLVGKTCSGKSTVAKILEKRGYDTYQTAFGRYFCACMYVHILGM